ncbi:MAG TPA: kelch repeat-containing protein [Dehalococcoidia bacterium]|nr:kelch repeat-containing protein [Dehalococcoidia bacterium]
MPTARHGLGAAVVGDSIYVIGGGETPGASVSDANEAYTP